MIPYPCWLPSASAVRIRNVASCIARSVIHTLYTVGLAVARPPELPGDGLVRPPAVSGAASIMIKLFRAVRVHRASGHQPWNSRADAVLLDGAGGWCSAVVSPAAADRRVQPGILGDGKDGLRRICAGQGSLLVVAGPGFEPGKAKPTVLQTAPFGRSGNLPCAAPQNGTVKDSGPSGRLRHVHATARALACPVRRKRLRPAPAPPARPSGGRTMPPRPAAERTSGTGR